MFTDILSILTLPFVWLACVAGGGYWLFFGFWFGRNAQDRARAADFFGLLAPGMAPHWQRLFGSWDIYENLKNVGSEWTRSDPQRAIKLVTLAWALSLISTGCVWYLTR